MLCRPRDKLAKFFIFHYFGDIIDSAFSFRYSAKWSYFKMVTLVMAATHLSLTTSLKNLREGFYRFIEKCELDHFTYFSCHIDSQTEFANVFWVSFWKMKNNSRCTADSFLRMTSLSFTFLLTLPHHRASAIANSPAVTSSIVFDYFLVVNLLFRPVCKP